jgi:hypothetical protein
MKIKTSPTARALLSAVLIAGLLTPASAAHADGDATAPSDAVVLKDGSKLRGTVIEEDPKRGVTMLLLDGTTRNVAKASLDHIDYAPTTPRRSAAPLVAPIAPIAPPPVVYGSSSPAPPVVMTHSNTGVVVAGAAMLGAGALLVLGGGVYYSSSTKNHTARYGQCPNVNDCNVGSETFHDSDGETIAAGLIVGGAVLVVAGAIVLVVGSRHHTVAPAAWLAAGTPHLALGEVSSPVFVTPSRGGLTLHF